MTEIDNFDRAELAETLQFRTGWLDGDRNNLRYSLADHLGDTTYNIGHLRAALARFTNLLQSPATPRPKPAATTSSAATINTPPGGEFC